jgi:hypothetical protein
VANESTPLDTLEKQTYYFENPAEKVNTAETPLKRVIQFFHNVHNALDDKVSPFLRNHANNSAALMRRMSFINQKKYIAFTPRELDFKANSPAKAFLFHIAASKNVHSNTLFKSIQVQHGKTEFSFKFEEKEKERRCNTPDMFKQLAETYYHIDLAYFTQEDVEKIDALIKKYENQQALEKNNSTNQALSPLKTLMYICKERNLDFAKDLEISTMRNEEIESILKTHFKPDTIPGISVVNPSIAAYGQNTYGSMHHHPNLPPNPNASSNSSNKGNENSCRLL